MGVTLAPEDIPVVVRTVFPCGAVLPDGTDLRLCKLFVTRERVYLYGPDAAGPVLLYEATYDTATAVLPPTFAPRSDLYRLDTPDGPLVARRLPGCGCNVRALKAFTPWAPLRVGR